MEIGEVRNDRSLSGNPLLLESWLKGEQSWNMSDSSRCLNFKFAKAYKELQLPAVSLHQVNPMKKD